MQGSLFKTTCLSRQFLEQICGGEANNRCYRMCPSRFKASHHSEPLAAMHSIAKNSQEYRSNGHPRNVTPDPIELLARCRLVGQCRKKVTSLLVFYSIISIISFKRNHHRSQHSACSKKSWGQKCDKQKLHKNSSGKKIQRFTQLCTGPQSRNQAKWNRAASGLHVESRGIVEKKKRWLFAMWYQRQSFESLLLTLLVW